MSICDGPSKLDYADQAHANYQQAKAIEVLHGVYTYTSGWCELTMGIFLAGNCRLIFLLDSP